LRAGNGNNGVHAMADEGWMMAGNGDLKAHESTYLSVTKMLFWGAIACAVIVALVIWAIA